MAVVSKGITLSYTSTATEGGIKKNVLTNLTEIPDLGGEVEAIEITTLADSAHVYTNGLKNYGDSLEFKFIYEAEQFQELNTLSAPDFINDWIVALPDGEECSFSGSCSVRLDGVGVNSALTYTLAIKPSSEMVWNFA